MLSPSFEPDLRSLLQPLTGARQTLLFSATMTQSLLQLQAQSLKDAHVYQVGGGRAWGHLPISG